MPATPPMLRIYRRYLQTPKRRYRNAAGRTVWLVGLLHVGQRRYYQQIRQDVDMLQDDGAKVHYESTKMTAAQIDLARPNRAEQEFLELLYDPNRKRYSPTQHWGWVDQLDGFSGYTPGGALPRMWPSGWEQHDLTALQIARQVGIEYEVRRVRTMHLENDAASRSRRIRSHFLAHQAMMYWIMARLGRIRNSTTDAVVIDARNTKAIKDADRVHGDVVLLYGASHLDGLHQLLCGRGYEMTEESWYTVGRLPPTWISFLLTMIHGALRFRPGRLRRQLHGIRARYRQGKVTMRERLQEWDSKNR